MAKDIKLKSAKKALQSLGFNVEYQSDNSLVAYYGEDNVPFLFIIHSPEDFPGLILNFSLDYLNVPESVNITINLMHSSPLTLGEQFYFNNKGELSTGEYAEIAFHMDNEIDTSGLSKWIPENKEGH